MKKVMLLFLIVGSFASAQTDIAAAPTSEVIEASKAELANIQSIKQRIKKTASKKNQKKTVAKGAQSLKTNILLAENSNSTISSDRAVSQKEDSFVNTAEIKSADGTLLPNQSTTTVKAKSAATAKVTGNLIIGAAAGVKDVKENGSKAMIDSSNSLILMYTVSDKVKVGASHNFGLRLVSDRSQLADFNSDNGVNSAYKTFDPTLNVNYKMEPLLGSNAYAIFSKFYVPVSEESRNQKSNGILRTQAFVTWTINPKIDISFFGQVRLYLNSSNNTDTKLGSDSQLRTIVGPVFGYNFNSVWNLYYNPYLDFKSANFQRGHMDAEVANNLSHEVGVWISIPGGSFIINPAFTTTTSKLGRTSYEGFGSDKNSEYDLNLIASF